MSRDDQDSIIKLGSRRMNDLSSFTSKGKSQIWDWPFHLYTCGPFLVKIEGKMDVET
jgi:hypothetical protein